MFRKSIILFGILGFLFACAPSRSDACPVTTPAQQTVSLPAQIEYEGRFWYGTPALWTNLPSDGVWWGLPHDGAGYVQKAVFWREGYDALSEPNPALSISGQKVDDPSQTFVETDTTHGWDESGNFMLVGISIPEDGCWEITAEVEQARLSYVVLVEPQ